SPGELELDCGRTDLTIPSGHTERSVGRGTRSGRTRRRNDAVAVAASVDGARGTESAATDRAAVRALVGGRRISAVCRARRRVSLRRELLHDQSDRALLRRLDREDAFSGSALLHFRGADSAVVPRRPARRPAAHDPVRRLVPERLHALAAPGGSRALA